MKGIIISLCDYTGKFVEPWVTFGYTAILVDPQHADYGTGPILKFPGTIEEAMPFLSIILATGQVKFVMGFPPCTDVAVSGAQWWAAKYKADPYFHARAAIVAEQCRTIGEMSGAPWAFENPVSAFSSIFGEPDYTFDPYDYSAYCADDQYFKKTCLWTGGGFIMPPPRHSGRHGAPDNRIHMASENYERANIRSATPFGFSAAVFLANCPEFRGQALPE